MFSLRVTYAIQLLSELERASRHGERLSVTELRTRCALESSGVTYVLCALRRNGWASQIRYRHCLTKDLTKATLYDLVIAMDDGIRLGTYCVTDLWSYQNRDRHMTAINFEQQLAHEFKERLKGTIIYDLLPSEKIKPKRSISRTPRPSTAIKASEANIE